ncbi:MAG: hypothetical protein IT383_01575 [Deltaproteobacteria bacterium]|nr:hypothetical protein [Deltaproteobacteria bacterium]
MRRRGFTALPCALALLLALPWAQRAAAEDPPEHDKAVATAPIEVGPTQRASTEATPASEELEALRRRVELLERRLADQAAAAAAPPAALPPPPPVPPALPTLRFQGYGELQGAFFAFAPDQNRQGGAQRDLRLELDTTRFVLELIAELPFDVEAEAEIELEHGGTGAAMELEYEEFGEFELEGEKGGEVLLEELFLTKRLGGHVAVSAGRFYVAVGQLSHHYRPVDYLGTTRSEAESLLLPAVWDEMGVQLQAWLPWLRATAQVVNGLDSTGFSSQRFIALGHQRRFELVRATDLAVVGRLDAFPMPDTELGLSAYYGGTSRNRPKPDLVKDCPDGADDVVAPCGYVDAPLTLVDAHGNVRFGPVRGSAMVLWGYLANAAAVSTRNERLSNALAVPRTPVSDQALLAWGELGLDVAPWVGLPGDHALEPFLRIDWADAMFLPREGLFDNPRFERLVVGVGASWSIGNALVLKLDASHRRFGSAELNSEETVRLALGFVY